MRDPLHPGPTPSGAEARELALLLELTDRVARAEGLEEVYEHALDALTSALGVARASILLFDDDGVLRFKAWRGLSDEYRRAVEGHSPWARDTLDPEPVLVVDAGADASLAPYRELLARERIGAIAFVPLIDARALVGKFMAYADAPRAFGPREVALARSIASHVAHAVGKRRARAAAETDRALLHEGERRLRVRLTRLQEITSALSRASTPREVATAAVRVGAAALGASSASLWIAEEDGGLRLEAAQGMDPRQEQEWARISPDSDAPVARALRTLEPIWVGGEAEFVNLDPTIAERSLALGRSMSFAGMPLERGGRALGVLVFAFGQRHAFDDEEKGFFGTVAQQCAQALDRSLLLEGERAANARLAVLAAAGELLSQTLDFDATLRAVTRSAVPAFADWAAVDLVEEKLIRRVAVSHRDPAKVQLGEELARRYPDRLDGESAVPRAIRTGVAILGRRIDDRTIDAAAADPEHAAILRELGLLSFIVAPIRLDGRPIGALSLATTAESGRLFGDRDLDLASELARRAGVALANASLFGREQAASRRAEEANRIKDEFLATVSHELRTPLNAILGWAMLLRGPKAGDPAATAKGLEVIRKNAQAQAKLVEDILDVSRIITGKLKIDPIPVDITAIIREAIEVVRPSVDAKGIQLELDPATEPLLLVGDPARLQQVVWNLLSNAAKFTDAGGSIHVAIERDGPQATLVVRDTGRGIAPEFLPRVFERFQQADSSTTRSYGGLGLGLAIVRHIVELHGGRVRAESEGIGVGSTFRVTLPIRALTRRVSPPPRAIPPASAAAAADLARALAGVHVLVVDDEPDARELIASVLEAAGAEVDAVDSAASALAAIATRRPDVLLSDVGMPGEDGYALIRSARELPGPALPAVALTAYARSEDRSRALAAGFDLHVSKPVEPLDLVRAVARLARAS